MVFERLTAAEQIVPPTYSHRRTLVYHVGLSHNSGNGAAAALSCLGDYHANEDYE